MMYVYNNKLIINRKLNSNNLNLAGYSKVPGSTSKRTCYLSLCYKLSMIRITDNTNQDTYYNNYQFLLIIIMKVFEKCIKSSLYTKCERFLDPRQHGFLNGKSCTTQMVPFIDNLTVALNNKSRVDIIYFDFAKAFDTVSHDLILRKLKYLYKIYIKLYVKLN